MAMTTKQRNFLKWSAAVLVGVFVFIGVKSCRDKDAKNKDADEQVIKFGSELGKVRKQLAETKDTLALTRDTLALTRDTLKNERGRADSLETANHGLTDSLNIVKADLEDCQNSKKPAVKKTTVSKPVQKSNSKPVAKPVEKSTDVVIKFSKEPVKAHEPVQMQKIDCEPVYYENPCEKQGKTEVNINTPYNTVNISNGGIINNYYNSQEKCAEEYNKEFEQYKKQYKLGNKVVRCR